mmetsp:Transcript_28279/g.79833  ORF Transcript_28279/g.79833 Transcript_28279/m.79833 type:complete len:81 (+) Transcript_28279:941-1183(+)
MTGAPLDTASEHTTEASTARLAPLAAAELCSRGLSGREEEDVAVVLAVLSVPHSARVTLEPYQRMDALPAGATMAAMTAL